jgi:hypothetical protein
MTQVCSICSSANRDVVDRLLVMGGSYRRIAARFSLTEQAVRRHKANHLPAALAKAQGAQEVAQADNLLLQLQWLQWKALTLLDAAEKAGDGRTALGAIREARGNIELLARLMGELNDIPQSGDFITGPEWASIRAMLMQALQAYPDARAEVAEGLLRLKEEGLA